MQMTLTVEGLSFLKIEKRHFSLSNALFILQK